MGAQVEGENTWKRRISPKILSPPTGTRQPCRELGMGTPVARGPQGVPIAGLWGWLGLGSQRWPGLFQLAAGSAVCPPLFKHSSCSSTTSGQAAGCPSAAGLAVSCQKATRAFLLPSLTFPRASITPNKHSLWVIVNFNGSVLASATR